MGKVFLTPSKFISPVRMLQYIESTGTQYINTNFCPTSNTRIICDIQLIGEPTSAVWLFGSRRASNVLNYALLYNGAGSHHEFRSDFGAKTGGNFYLNYSSRIIFDKNKNITSCSISDQEQTLPYVDFITDNPLAIFAINEQGQFKNNSNMRCFDFKIYDNNILVHNYKPAWSKDGIGLYDTLKNKMYLNSGSGEFLPGPEVK